MKLTTYHFQRSRSRRRLHAHRHHGLERPRGRDLCPLVKGRDAARLRLRVRPLSGLSVQGVARRGQHERHGNGDDRRHGRGVVRHWRDTNCRHQRRLLRQHGHRRFPHVGHDHLRQPGGFPRLECKPIYGLLLHRGACGRQPLPRQGRLHAGIRRGQSRRVMACERRGPAHPQRRPHELPELPRSRRGNQPRRRRELDERLRLLDHDRQLSEPQLLLADACRHRHERGGRGNEPRPLHERSLRLRRLPRRRRLPDDDRPRLQRSRRTGRRRQRHDVGRGRFRRRIPRRCSSARRRRMAAM